MALIDEAKAYLAMGLSVIPALKNKRPAVDWTVYQTRHATEEELHEWFVNRQFPSLGFVTGKISGITVVDVDVKRGGNTDGLTPSVMVKTGGGGWHFYYKYTPLLKTGVDIVPGVDIRNDGGFIVAPPSIHPSGIAYEWVEYFDRDIIVNLPAFLLEKGKVQSTERKDWGVLSTGAMEGSRNTTATKVIGRILAALPIELWRDAFETVRSWNKKSLPPLSEEELMTTFNSVSQKEFDARKSGKKNILGLYENPEEVVEEDSEILLFEEAAKLHVEAESTERYPTGFKVFDDAMLGGFHPGDLNVITAPTGMGKTSFAQTITLNLAHKKIPTLWFSYEVLVSELWRKFKNMGMPREFLSYIPLKHVTGKVSWLQKKIVEAKNKFGTKVIFIDHLGFLLPSTGYDKQMSQNYSAYLTTICRDLKTTALNEKVTIVLLVHMRKTEGTGTINDIRDSSGISQEADMVFTLNRVPLYTPAETKKKSFSTPPPMLIPSYGEVYTDQTKLALEKNRRTGITKVATLKMRNDVFVDEFQEINSMVQDNFGTG